MHVARFLKPSDAYRSGKSQEDKYREEHTTKKITIIIRDTRLSDVVIGYSRLDNRAT
jgi:hypothetical protein